MAEESTNKRTDIKQVGEFGLIDRINQQFTLNNERSVLGIGDDAAVLNTGDHYTLISTDMLLEGIHFDLSYVPLGHLGYKAVAVNVSDIAAMNGIATQITVNIGLSNRFSVEAVDALYEGIRHACENYNVDLVGGDTTSSASGLVISVTVIGEVKKEKLVRRSGAQINDIVCVTGDLGGAYIGLQVLERERVAFLENPSMQPQLKEYEYIVGRQLRPDARVDIIHELRDLDVVPTAMIDISDGLASELFHLARQSGVGFNIYEKNIPIDQSTFKTAVEFKLDPITCALNGGEDYELLFTIQQHDFEEVKSHPDIHFIGYVQDKEKGLNLITDQKQVVPLQAQGWNHLEPFQYFKVGRDKAGAR